MRGRIFIVLSALSLLLCLTACGLWARSYWQSDTFVWLTGPNHKFSVVFMQRRAMAIYSRATRSSNYSFWPDYKTAGFRHASSPADQSGDLDRLMAADGEASSSQDHHWHDFGYDSGHYRFGWLRRTTITVPIGFPILLFAILPLARFGLRHKRRPGYCRACGYDLRGTPDRCPECGTVSSNVLVLK